MVSSIQNNFAMDGNVHQWHNRQLFSQSMQQLRTEQGVEAAGFSHRPASAIAEQLLILSVHCSLKYKMEVIWFVDFICFYKKKKLATQVTT